jgi:hypothetical protein
MPKVSQTELIVHSTILALNILLFLVTRPLLAFIHTEGDLERRIRVFQTLNVVVLLLHIIDLIVLRVTSDYQHYWIRIGLSLLAIYVGLFTQSLCHYFSRRRFGKEKQLDDQRIFVDSYSSRLVDIVALVVITFMVVYAIIKIWGADSLLETTGIFGILAAFLAFTSSIWAPDIISGLIILNTQLLEDGDVVVIDGFPDEYIISKVTLIYVVLYDIRNNHRSLIRNSHFTQSKIDNLSRVASTDGVRQSITYQIGYPDVGNGDKEERKKRLQSFQNRIHRMFTEAQESCTDKKDIMLNNRRSFEWALTETGNYALHYTLWFYLDKMPNTKVTATVRKYLIGTRFKVNEAVYSAAINEQIDLATPDIGDFQFSPKPQPQSPSNQANVQLS